MHWLCLSESELQEILSALQCVIDHCESKAEETEPQALIDKITFIMEHEK